MLSIRQRPVPDGVAARLDDSRALDPELSGNKAASLARARRARLPVLPGFVIRADTAAALARSGEHAAHVEPAVAEAWAWLSEEGQRALVVRSSSSAEDSATSSMAGLFTSILEVQGWDAFLIAVAKVVDSGNVVALAEPAPRARTMAVLVQPYLDAAVGGVLFGADPVSGRLDRLVVSAVAGGPERLVQGEEAGRRFVLSTRGRVLEGDGASDGLTLTRTQLAALARLAAKAGRLFGGPQDIEWAIDRRGRLWLLQSRPITTLAAPGRVQGPVLGPGPVAETFPEPLAPLEADLWVEPVRRAVAEAINLAGTSSRRAIRRSPVITTVRGRVAADLTLLGSYRAKQHWLRHLDPRPSLRRLRAAWRVGRLRAALPGLARDLVELADRDLLGVPSLHELGDDELLGVIDHGRAALVSMHGHEVLAGLLLSSTAPSVTAASAGLRALAEGRRQGLSDAEIIVREPVVLSLVAPAISRSVALPASPGPVVAVSMAPSDPAEPAVLREALRLRARWLHELTARAAWELGERLANRGHLAHPQLVRSLRLEELRAAIAHGAVPDDVTERSWTDDAPLLPAAFRLTSEGAVVPLVDAARTGSAGQGAGGGRATGRVAPGDRSPEPGEVLVVRTLDPTLAPFLPRLAGLVAETGSVLSHLAILAREFDVPTVVGVADALTRFPAGTLVTIDGTSGDVAVVEESDEVVA